MVLAIDWGSQSARCALFTPEGERISLATLKFAAPGFASSSVPVYPARVVRQHLWQLIRQCLAQANGGQTHPSLQIDALAICAQRSGLLALAHTGEENIEHSADQIPHHSAQALEPIGPALSWHEAQRHPLPPRPPWWIRIPISLIGQHQHLIDLLERAPANRMRAHHPQIWQRARYLVPWSSFLNWCLCGEVRDGISAATGIYPFDFRNANWHAPKHWTWQALSSRPEQMVGLQPGATMIGRLNFNAARATGLPCGVPVIACGADKAAEAFGAGAWQPGDIHLSLGTAVCVSQLNQPRWNWNPLKPTFPTLLSECVINEHKMELGMSIIRSLLDQAQPGQVQRESTLDKHVLTHLTTQKGLFCYPQYCPKEGQTWLSALGQEYPLEQVYPALLLGIACRLQECLSRHSSATAKLYVSGGGSQGQEFIAALAQVLNRPLLVAQDPQCGLRGAAICAALGAQWFRDQNAARGMLGPTRLVKPDVYENGKLANNYRDSWQKYRELKRPWYSADAGRA